MQVRELTEYCARRGWEVFRSYSDSGWSGTKASRPQLDQLMRDARLRHFDCVLCWKLDRWGRSLLNCVQSIEELRSFGVGFIALLQGLDTTESNSAGKFMLNILASCAEFERELIKERVVCGLKAAKAKGVKLGPPVKVWRRDEALRLRAEGLSWRRIAAQLGVPESSVRAACSGECAANPSGKPPLNEAGNQAQGVAA